MSQAISLEPAYLLSLRPYRDSSQLLEVFGVTQGRIGLVARGARGPKSRLRGVLQPFAPLLLSWTQRGDLGSLTGAEAQSAPVALSGERIFFGWYLNELLLRLLQRHDPHPALYAIYATLLPELAGSETQAQSALRVFEKRLLEELGYGLMLPDAIEADRLYRYDPDYGPLPAEKGIPGASLIALRDERLEGDIARQDARRLLRDALRRQLGDRELQTATLLRNMRAQSKATRSNQ
ncbi:MAG: DNA repair protein RecO [Pseudomonadota bacterium]|nr:DNA repair protein RecO [Pseudomonadota bacterium]